MKKAISILLSVLMLTSVFAGLNTTALAAPKYDGTGQYLSETGKWYYFNTGNDPDDDDGVYRYAMRTGWLLFNDGTYYCDPVSGKMLTGNQTIDGEPYTFDTSGRLKTA